MNCGKIVERRDQVFTTFLPSVSFNFSIFVITCSSTTGPFFKLRPMIEPPFVIALRFPRTVAQSRYFLRRRTINLSDLFFFLRVLYPRVGLPHGDIGDLRPIGERPSPPPCGWSLGFITDPRT